jgi:fused signal recognition particle receptor
MAFRALLDRLKKGLEKTLSGFGRRLQAVFAPGRLVDEAFVTDVQETLLMADVGPETAERLAGELRQAYRALKVRDSGQALAWIKERFRGLLAAPGEPVRFAPAGPTVVLVCGVNGSGKTTSIAKLARFYKERGKSVVLAAGDTFRAAAIEQLTIWSKRLGVELVKHKDGADPAAVAFDAAEAAAARGTDLLIIDTAGRLQTRENLMRELEKIRRVVQKKIPGAPHESLLVLDATTGQNALSQAKHFGAVAGITGIFLAKLDGTARGGVVLSIRDQLGIPVRFVGLGEGPEDLQVFDPEAFVEALFEK